MSQNEPRRLVQPPNRFEEDFGTATEAQRERIVEILRGFMSDMRKILEESLRMTRVASPERVDQCHTCAFNPKTDVLAGFAPTAYGVLTSILNDRIFACHNDNPDWKDQHKIDADNPTICNGFYSVRLFSGARTTLAAVRAMRAIRDIVPKKK